MLKKIDHEPSGGQIVKSHEIIVFRLLSYKISSSNGNHLSRPNCTQTLILLQILSLNSPYAIIEREVAHVL